MTRNSFIRPFSSKKKLFLMFSITLFLMFFVSFASATTWTQTSTWSEEDMKVTFTNWWGLGGEQGSMELVSHDYVKQVKSIWAGILHKFK